MRTATGVFHTLDNAEQAISGLRGIGIPQDKINLLTPSNLVTVPKTVPTSASEQTGMGKAVGGLVGGVSGAALGSLGAAFISLAVPGVGTVAAVGFFAAALLATGGAVAGAALGGALEKGLAEGLPKDELFIYEDALRQGRTVVIALAEDEKQADEAREVLSRAGAESIDAARKQWWVGLREAEKGKYVAEGQDFVNDEPAYQTGFVAALHPELRGKPFKEGALRSRYPEFYKERAFRYGYDRGQEYDRELKEKYK